MAPFRFTQNVERGDYVTVYNKGLMDRDSTYIDDIVSGLMAAMNYVASVSAWKGLGNFLMQVLVSLCMQ